MNLRDQIISQTGIIPLEGVVVKIGDETPVRHRGVAGIQFRNEPELTKILPGNVILSVQLYDEKTLEPFTITTTVEAKHVIEAAQNAAAGA